MLIHNLFDLVFIQFQIFENWFEVVLAQFIISFDS